MVWKVPILSWDRALARRQAALFLLLVGMLLWPGAPALADCTFNGSAVTCTGTGGPHTTPVGTGVEDNFTVDIQSGATVDLSASPGATAIDLNDFNIVNNSGSVIGGGFGGIGIRVNNGNTVINNGSILVDDFGIAIEACCDNTILNHGIITAGSDGFGIFTADRTNLTNSGTINVGDASAAVFAGSDSTIVNNGVMSAGDGGAGISADNQNFITNAGSITIGDGFGGFALSAGFDNVVVNSGTIAVGLAATGIAVDANTVLPAFNSVTNSGSISFGTFGTGIIVTENHRVLNSGTITGANLGFGIQVFDNNIITNTGTIIVGMNSSGVQFRNANNVLDNYGLIRSAGGMTIEACDCSTNNAFNNMAGGTLDGYMFVDGVGNTVTNSGLVTVTDPASALIGYPTFLITNTNLAGAGNTFVQTASGTLALRMNNAGLIDNLSADAITARGTLRITLLEQLYQNTTFSGTGVGLTPYGAATLGNTITSGFDRYVASSPFFVVTPIYDTGDPTSYTGLSFQLDRIPFGTVPGATPNQRAVGQALEQGYSPGLDPNSIAGQFYIALFQVPSLSVLDQLSGAGTAASQDAAFTTGNMFNGTMLQQGMAWLNGGNGFSPDGPSQYAATPKDRFAGRAGHDAFAAMQPPPPGRWRVWGLGFGATRSIDGQAAEGTFDQTINAGGGAFGVDRQIAPDLLLGFAAGASGSRYSVSGLSTDGRADAGHVGLYAVKTFGPTYLAAALNYARADNKIDRTITGVGPTENASGRFASDQFSGRLEVGWKHAMRGFSVTPFAAIEPGAVWQRAYSETSTTLAGTPGVLGLSYQSNRVTSFPGFLGAQIDARYQLAGGQTLSPFARVAWMHEFKPERSIQASFVTIPSGSFLVEGARAAENALRIEAGATLRLNETTAFFANLNSELSDRSRSFAGMAGARVSW